jgi:hypothetical protein
MNAKNTDREFETVQAKISRALAPCFNTAKCQIIEGDWDED